MAIVHGSSPIHHTMIAPTDSDITLIRERAVAGERLTRDDAIALLQSHDLTAIGQAAHAVTERGAEKTVVESDRLSEEGAVAAIYMGLKSAHLLSGRLLMHGIDPETPVTVLENVSRPNQKIVVSSVAKLPKLANSVGEDGPVILMLGLEPREAVKAMTENETQFVEAGVL